jgi:hypothetical protein
MKPSLHYYESLYRSTKADWDLFRRWTDFLPRRAPEDPYHSGPHNLQRFRMVYELLRPRSVLEIGFNLGHSATIWLELGVATVCSTEIRIVEPVLAAEKAIKRRYEGRFNLDRLDGTFPHLPRYDLGFVDGSHEYPHVVDDISRCLELQVPYLLMDDYDSHHGPGVVAAVEHHNLIPLAIFGTMALCAPPTRYTQKSDPHGNNYYE